MAEQPSMGKGNTNSHCNSLDRKQSSAYAASQLGQDRLHRVKRKLREGVFKTPLMAFKAHVSPK